jgi:hypothetical protein
MTRTRSRAAACTSADKSTFAASAAAASISVRKPLLLVNVAAAPKESETCAYTGEPSSSNRARTITTRFFTARTATISQRTPWSHAPTPFRVSV